MIYRLEPSNFQEDGAVVAWRGDQVKMSNTCVWYPARQFRPLVRRLSRIESPFNRGSYRKTSRWIYRHCRRTFKGLPTPLKRAQKSGITWMQEQANRQWHERRGLGAKMKNIDMAADLMLAHKPPGLTRNTYTARIYKTERPDLTLAAQILGDYIETLTGIDFTDRAVLDVLCPVA